MTATLPRVLEVLASHLRNSDKLCPSLNQLLCETSGAPDAPPAQYLARPTASTDGGDPRARGGGDPRLGGASGGGASGGGGAGNGALQAVLQQLRSNPQALGLLKSNPPLVQQLIQQVQASGGDVHELLRMLDLPPPPGMPPQQPPGGDPRGGDPRGGDSRGGEPRGGGESRGGGEPRGGEHGDSWGSRAKRAIMNLHLPGVTVL